MSLVAIFLGGMVVGIWVEYAIAVKRYKHVISMQGEKYRETLMRLTALVRSQQ